MTNLTLDRPTSAAAPEGAASLTATQQQTLASLAATVDRDQAIWLSGYFAGMAGATAALPAAGELGGSVGGAVVASPAVSAQGTVTILYASDTGNSKELAGQLGEAARANGRSAEVCDVAKYKPKNLKNESEVLLVVATHGEGDPPPSALDFFEFIEGKKAPKLPELSFAVLALGDSTYEHFCSAGKRVDARLEELGAKRLLDRVDCDVDYEDAAEAWISEVVARLEAPSADAPAVAAAGAVLAPAAASSFNKKNPFSAEVIDNLVLTGRGSSKETRHIEFSIEDSGLTFEPGDALGVYPQNDPALVEELIGSLGLSAGDEVEIKGEALPLGEALTSRLEITAATPRFLEHWGELTEAEALLKLRADEHRAERTRLLAKHQVLDIVESFPLPGVDAAQLVAGLRPLQPRLYSIASSLAANPDEVHLTVSTVRYEALGRRRAGVASCWLAGLTDDDSAPVYVQENEHFRLPEDDRRVVMIGAGTGVAPYRAFMQEREERGATGESWLFFGERNFRSDFLYQVEWQQLLEDGQLSRLDLAFSRDQGQKIYVQDKIREAGAELYSWIDDGAILYVCGDAEKMAPDVQAALADVIEQHGSVSAETAEATLSELRRENRLLLDVY